MLVIFIAIALVVCFVVVLSESDGCFIPVVFTIIYGLLLYTLFCDYQEREEYKLITNSIEESYGVHILSKGNILVDKEMPVTFTYKGRQYSGVLEVDENRVRINPETIVDSEMNHTYNSNIGKTNVSSSESDNNTAG